MPHCFISGISGGIGLAMAEAAHAAGWQVSGCARRAEVLAALETRLGERCCCQVADVCDAAATTAAVAAAVARFGPLDALVANAGRGRDGALLELSPADLRGLFELNLIGVHHLVLAAADQLAPGAVIQIVSSVVAQVPVPLMGAYCASKHAIDAYAASLRMELRERGIAVVTVNPGTVDTDFFDHAAAAGGAAWTWRPGRPLNPAVLARRMLRQLLRRRPRRLFTPWSAGLMAWGYRSLPGCAEWVMGRVLRSLRAAGLRTRDGQEP